LIEDLLDLPTGPIRKISSGGYVTAALTAGNDLYIWGGRPGQQKILSELSGRPVPVDLDGEDVQDIAIGFEHMLAITVTNRLFVIGSGSNGQLGLGVKQLKAWEEVTLPLKENQQIVKVYAGYKSSFLIIEEKS
jgi:alpha-tubulin suppressor-like RCC1 family protein